MAPGPSDSELKATYNDFEQCYPSQDILMEESDFAMFARDRFSFATAGRDLSQPKKILEVGSSYGLFLRHFLKTSWEIHGVEPSVLQGKFCRHEFGIENIQTCMLAEADLEPGFFDIACSFHVIEHLKNPLAMLRKIRSLLKPNGRLFLATPNLARLDASITQYYFLYHALHLMLFTPGTINTALRACGFEVVRWHQEVDRAAESGSMILEAKPCLERLVYYPEEIQYARSYIDKLTVMKTKLTDSFRKWMKQGRRVAIYGGGTHTQGVFDLIGEAASSIKMIFDDDTSKSGKNLDGIAVVPFCGEPLKKIDVIVVSSLASESRILDKLSKIENLPDVFGIYRDILTSSTVSH